MRLLLVLVLFVVGALPSWGGPGPLAGAAVVFVDAVNAEVSSAGAMNSRDFASVSWSLGRISSYHAGITAFWIQGQRYKIRANQNGVEEYRLHSLRYLAQLDSFREDVVRLLSKYPALASSERLLIASDKFRSEIQRYRKELSKALFPAPEAAHSDAGDGTIHIDE